MTDKKPEKKIERKNSANDINHNLEGEKEKKKTVYVETNENIMNRVKIYEDREKKNKSLKEELDYRQKIYEQNRANMEKMRKLKQFLKDRRDFTKTNEEFFEIHREFFSQYGVKSYDELLKLISNFDKENPEEVEREILEKYLKNLKIEKQLYEDGKNGFSILPKIDNKFENLKISLPSLSDNIYYSRSSNNFNRNSKICEEINNFEIYPDIEKYLREKISKYEIKNPINKILSYPANKKIKYNPEKELIMVSDIENIYLEGKNNNILSKGEDYMENGIPINELINSKLKIILGRLSENDKNNYKKIENIIKDLNDDKNNDFYNKILKKNFCIDCDKSFEHDDGEESSLHCEHNLIQIKKDIANELDEELNININELDYNSSLNKLYENLKKEQNKVLKYGKSILINFYADLLYHLYEIIVNNNSIEDLIESIIKINELYETKIKSIKEGEVNMYFKNYFLFYVKRITKLSYYKLKKIEKLMADLFDINNNIKKDEETDILDDNSDSEYQNKFFDSFKIKKNDLDTVFENDNLFMNNKKQLDKEGNKKYFLRLGLDLKFKYDKNESINELYNKALENKIEPHSYENFLLKELNIVERQSD